MNYELSIFCAIRHNMSQNIPKIWSVLQLYLLLQRQNDRARVEKLN